jgi:hypothetical protein
LERTARNIFWPKPAQPDQKPNKKFFLTNVFHPRRAAPAARLQILHNTWARNFACDLNYWGDNPSHARMSRVHVIPLANWDWEKS